MYFRIDEDFTKILNKYINNIQNISKITKGWTNIVFDVETNKERYIVRFPRNDFFSKQIEKDVTANEFLRKTINLRAPEMNLLYDNNRPFSIHKKISGIDLSKRIDYLNSNQIDNITHDIAEFYYQIHNINIDSIPSILNIRLSDFLTELAKVDDNYYDYSSLEELRKDEDNNLVFVHGDLNIGNILLNEQDNIVAFLDFSFAGLSDIYCDLSRISCRVDDKFLSKILNNYERLSNKTLDLKKIDKRNQMWKYIEEQYIIYMKNHHPEIEIPNS